MTLEFIKQINEYIIEAILELNNEEILASIGDCGHPSHQDIKKARVMINQAIKTQRQDRLAQKKAAFMSYKKEQRVIQGTQPKRTISEMLSDIVIAMRQQQRIPEGMILAFREQGQEGSEDDIADIWQNLVELNLIDPNETNKQ